MWRNGPGGRWTARIIWFENSAGDRFLEHNFRPTSRDEAERIWKVFRGYAEAGMDNFLEEMAASYV
jgi:hypothetical protein